MKLIPLLLLCATSLQAQIPESPTGLRVASLPPAPSTNYPLGATIPLPVTMGTNNPLGYELLGKAAWWYRPDTNVWAPEASINGLEWAHAGSQWSSIGDRANRTSTNGYIHFGWSYTEATNDPNVNWQVRIKRIK